jgi:hypothetical protein
MKIYAFYQSVPNAVQADEFGCANWWKTSWEHSGWSTVMLNKSHAQGSSMYNKLQQKLAAAMNASQALTARSGWFHSRFTRWCALHAAGGGWMSDYDVLNIALTPLEAKKQIGDKTLVVNEGPAYLFYASAEHCTAALKKMLSEDLTENGVMRNEIDILGASVMPESITQLVKHFGGIDKKPDAMRDAYQVLSW